jgi:HSP20 family protein
MLWTDVFRGLNQEPFTELKRLQSEMNRLFGERNGNGNGNGNNRVFPPVNIYPGKEDVLITAELPGVDPGAIDINILGDTLTLSGVRKEKELGDGEVCHREERPSGEFHRTLELPVRVNAEKVEARYGNGMLRLTLPRAEEDKPKQIKVKV